MDILQIVSKSGIVYNSCMLERYVKFIEAFRSSKVKGETEMHHILPKSMFPQYANLKTYAFNKAHLPTRAHYVAHLLLCKVFHTTYSVWYAFYCMSHQANPLTQNRKQVIKVNSRMYQAAKIIVSNMMSKKRLGIALTEAHVTRLKQIRSTAEARRGNIWRQYKDRQRFSTYEHLAAAICASAPTHWNIPSAISNTLDISIDTVSSVMRVENIDRVVSQTIAKVFKNYGHKFKSYDEYCDAILQLHSVGHSVFVI